MSGKDFFDSLWNEGGEPRGATQSGWPPPLHLFPEREGRSGADDGDEEEGRDPLQSRSEKGKDSCRSRKESRKMTSLKNWEAQARTNSILAGSIQALEARVDDCYVLLDW